MSLIWYPARVLPGIKGNCPSSDTLRDEVHLPRPTLPLLECTSTLAIHPRCRLRAESGHSSLPDTHSSPYMKARRRMPLSSAFRKNIGTWNLARHFTTGIAHCNAATDPIEQPFVTSSIRISLLAFCML